MTSHEAGDEGGDGDRVDQELPPATREFYRHTLKVLTAAEVPFLVGGAYAFERYTGIVRHTKDLDLFARRRDVEAILGALERAGYRTDLTYPHWLGKAFCGDDVLDVIFAAGNGLARVDDTWFARAPSDTVVGLPVRLCPPEEMIWSKSFVMERERFDGADVAHLLRARGRELDWRHLLTRFGDHWRVLFGQLILFGYIYPGERDRVPAWVLTDLAERLRHETETAAGDDMVCRGTLLSRAQYLVDVDRWGYRDGRLPPTGYLTPDEITHWTAAIDDG